MPTPEEIAAAEKAAADKEAAEKAAKEKAEAEAKDFEIWVSTQPKDVQERYSAHTNGLKSALEKERELNKNSKGALEKLAQLEAEAEKKRKAEMTELDRLKAEKVEAEEKAKKLEREKLQRQAADKAGIPEFADRLQGETLEEMEADAKKIANAIKNPARGASTSATNPGRQGTLSLDDIKKMPQEEINKRWDEVQKALKEQGQG